MFLFFTVYLFVFLCKKCFWRMYIFVFRCSYHMQFFYRTVLLFVYRFFIRLNFVFSPILNFILSVCPTCGQLRLLLLQEVRCSKKNLYSLLLVYFYVYLSLLLSCYVFFFFSFFSTIIFAATWQNKKRRFLFGFFKNINHLLNVSDISYDSASPKWSLILWCLW